MTATDGRALCLIFLSSIGDGLRWLLPMSDEFDQKYSLLSYVSYQPTAHYDGFSQDLVDRCDVLICHPLDNAPISDRARYTDFLQRFPASTRKILVPWPRFGALWPFHRDEEVYLPLPLYQPFWPHYTRDPAASDPARSAGVRGEVPSFPFGDSYVVGKLQEGLSPAETVSAYLASDVASVVDLDRLSSECLAAIARDERGADLKVADFVATTFRDRKLFAAPQLASNRLLLHIANAALQLLRLPPLAERLLDQLQPLIKIEAPIHPSIGRFFGAPYIGERTRYLVDRHRNLTFSEYLRGYVDWLAGRGFRQNLRVGETRGFKC